MDTLYHYCPTEAFHSIISSKTIWLSELTSSNDSMEGKLISAAIMRLAKHDRLKEPSIISLQRSLSHIERGVEGMGFCLSKDNDLLTQWLLYSARATGVAIGFSKEYLEQLGREASPEYLRKLRLIKVAYGESEHEAQVRPIYDKVALTLKHDFGKSNSVYKLYDSDDTSPSAIHRVIDYDVEYMNYMTELYFGVIPNLYVLKGPDFQQEREWRLVSTYFVGTNEVCLYRTGPVPGRLIPYKEIPLVDSPIQSINKIMLGPKHLTPIHQVKDFLAKHGYRNVDVERSKSSYK